MVGPLAALAPPRDLPLLLCGAAPRVRRGANALEDTIAVEDFMVEGAGVFALVSRHLGPREREREREREHVRKHVRAKCVCACVHARVYRERVCVFAFVCVEIVYMSCLCHSFIC